MHTQVSKNLNAMRDFKPIEEEFTISQYTPVVKEIVKEPVKDPNELSATDKLIQSLIKPVAVDLLKNDTSLRPQFVEKWGERAAELVLQGKI